MSPLLSHRVCFACETSPFFSPQGNGRWYELVLGGAAYAVVRLNRLPITLLEVAGAVGWDQFAVGRTYKALCSALGIAAPEARTQRQGRGGGLGTMTRMCSI